MTDGVHIYGSPSVDNKLGVAGCKVIAHALETGAVSQILIEKSLSAGFTLWIGHLLQLEEQEVSSLIVFLAAAHDIGKVNPGFQNQIEGFRSGLQSNG